MGTMASEIISLTIGLLNRLIRRISKKTSKLRFTGLCEGNSPVTGEFPHKRPVTRKMFPFDDVIKCHFAFTSRYEFCGDLAR